MEPNEVEEMEASNTTPAAGEELNVVLISFKKSPPSRVFEFFPAFKSIYAEFRKILCCDMPEHALIDVMDLYLK